MLTIRNLYIILILAGAGLPGPRGGELRRLGSLPSGDARLHPSQLAAGGGQVPPRLHYRPLLGCTGRAQGPPQLLEPGEPSHQGLYLATHREYSRAVERNSFNPATDTVRISSESGYGSGPNPDPGFWCSKTEEKNTAGNFLYFFKFFWSKIAIYLSLAPP